MPDGPLGIFGGTFDPVHFGHLRLAEEAREALGLARVVWVPAGLPPLRDAPGRSAADRLAMVNLAIAGNPAFGVDPAEVEAAGTSYTVLTLTRLRAAHGPVRPLVLLLGADAFGRLDEWHRWREIFTLAHVAVATRPGHALTVSPGATATGAGEPGWAAELRAEFEHRQGEPADLAASPAGRVVPFAMSGLEISATALRAQFAAARSPRYLAPDAVLDYIERHRLYLPPLR